MFYIFLNSTLLFCALPSEQLAKCMSLVVNAPLLNQYIIRRPDLKPQFVDGNTSCAVMIDKL